MKCPSCGTVAADGARFCASCGQELRRRNDERRVVTVLFADLVGFTSLSETRDPEQVKNLVDACFERLVADIDAYGGRVDKIIGDAIVALFGAPTAHEDDAERAVRAGLQLQRTVAAWTASQGGIPLRLRVGVNTGEVLVGALRAGGDYTAMGDVVNTASRLQTSAEPGSVVVGLATYAATRGVVRYTGVGSIQAKGRDEPIEAWIAEEALMPPGARPNRGRAPLVGRDPELGLLAHAVDAAVARSRAHLLLLVGEAGLGKTRLAEEVAAQAECDHGALVLEGRCVPYGEANVWWPVAEALRSGIDVLPTDPFEVAAERTAASVRQQYGKASDAEVERVTDGLLRLLGYENSLTAIDPSRAREEVSRSLFGFIEASARNRPLVVVLSDLHWADDIVLARIDELFDRMSGLPFVLVGTARQSLLERWVPRSGRHNVVVFNLDPLDRTAATNLLAAIVEGDLPDDLRDLVLDRSGGNPFYLEELVALVTDAGMVGALPPGTVRAIELPDTLRGLVAARLDGLTQDERLVLEDAAVMGRRGTIAALEIMAEKAHGRQGIRDSINGLVDKDILDVTARKWSFRSDLVREVAYGTLTKADRARRHAGIAKWMEANDNEREASVDRIAHHYAVAAALAAEVGVPEAPPGDLTDKAVLWLDRALSQAESGELYLVAVQLCTHALDLADLVPPDSRLRFLLARAHALAQLRDLERARADLDVAMDLTASTDDKVGRARALLGLGDVEQKAANLDASLDTLAEAVVTFRSLGDDLGTAEALRARGFTLMFMECNKEAETSFTEALGLYRAGGDRRGEAWALQNLAWLSFSRGQSDQADVWLQESAATFSAIKDAGGLGWALGLLAWVRFHQGRFAESEELANQILGEARTRGDQWAAGMMLVLLAALRLWSGRSADAVDSAHEAVNLFRTMGDWYGRSQAVGALARSLAASGRPEEAFEVLEESDDTGAASITVAPGVRLADVFGMLIAAQTGLAERVGIPVRDPDALEGDPGAVGFQDLHVAIGMLHLQRGDVSSSLPFLERAVLDDRNPNALAALALATAAAGHPERSPALAAEAVASDRATYLDRITAWSAQSLAHAQSGDADAAVAAAETARALADDTDDVLAQAIVRLAGAEVLGALDLPGAAEYAAEADERLRAAGVGDTAWRRAFRLALTPEPRDVPVV